CATNARPTPVLPEVGSTIVPPGFSSPDASAASIILVAMRSFDEPPGFRYSTFTSTVAAIPSVTLLSLTRGVLPTRSSTVSAYFMVEPIYQRPLTCYRVGAGIADAFASFSRLGSDTLGADLFLPLNRQDPSW